MSAARFDRVVGRLFDRIERVLNAATRQAALIAGFALILASAVFPWVQPPLGKAVRGVSFPLLGHLGLMPHPELFSYGLVALGIAFLALVLGWKWNPIAGICGAVLLVLAAAAPMQVAFSNPAALRQIASEFNQYESIREFSDEFLPVNKGIESNLLPLLTVDTPWQRLVTAWYFFKAGWYLNVTGALLIVGAVMIRMRSGRAWYLVAALCLLLVVTIQFSIGPVRGGFELERAVRARMSGNLDAAIDCYRRVLELDRWYSTGPEIYAEIGALERGLNRPESSEQRLQRGILLDAREMWAEAIAEFLAASRAEDPALAEIARREAARVYSESASPLYVVGGYGSALQNWHQAVALDPGLISAWFFLMQSAYELSEYRRAILAAEMFDARSGNDYVRANALSTMADSYARLGDFVRARFYYTKSLNLDETLNYRALTALAGG